LEKFLSTRYTFESRCQIKQSSFGYKLLNQKDKQKMDDLAQYYTEGKLSCQSYHCTILLGTDKTCKKWGGKKQTLKPGKEYKDQVKK
jgi:hypothetical protein